MRPVVHVVSETGRVIRSTVLRTTACGKQGYTGRKEAKARAKWAQRETGERIEAYHCRSCHAWHIGHPIGSREQAS